MPAAEQYRVKAAEIEALARKEQIPSIRREFYRLAQAYLRLAEQADRNALTDVVYETPPGPNGTMFE